MNYKILKSAIFVFISSCILTSCNETNTLISNGTTSNDPLSIIAKAIKGENLEGDFTIEVSSVAPIRPLGGKNAETGSVVIYTHAKDLKSPEGDLIVNNISIPYSENSHFLQIESTSSVLGKELNFDFISGSPELFPSFNTNHYSPLIPNITVLSDKNGDGNITQGEAIEVQIEREENLPENVHTIFFICNDKEIDNYIIKEVPNDVEIVNIEASEIANLGNDLKFIVGTGYYSTENIDDKLLALFFFSYTWDWLTVIE